MTGRSPGVPMIECLDCPASWGLTDTPAPCFAQGHRAELNGTPVEYNPALDAFARRPNGKAD